MNLRKTKERDLKKMVDAMNVQDLFDTLAERGRAIRLMRTIFRMNGKTHSSHALDLVIQIKTLKKNFYKQHPHPKNKNKS